MISYLDIATSYYSESLTLIIGTGFSKWITNGKAPNWLELLIYCIDRIEPSLKDYLLVKTNENNYVVGEIPLTIVAQILENEAKKNNMNLKNIVCEYIKIETAETNIDNSKVELFRSMFEAEKSLNIITTNYDTILSDYIFPSKCRIFTDGDFFNKLPAEVDIFHIHGIVKKPYSLTLTQNDYYNFQIKNNYFSQKLYTLIYENNIGIIGYSLNDYDINSILNEANTQKPKVHNNNNGDIFYITKNDINNKLKEFYKLSFDIEVFDNTTFEEFIKKFCKQKKDASKTVESFSSINAILSSDGKFDNDFIKTRISFYQIIIHLTRNGLCLSDAVYYDILINVLNKKVELCHMPNEWANYDHLSNWLIELLSLFEFNASHKKKIEDIILYSLNTCSQTKILGCSWDAYQIWNNKWKYILPKNQTFVAEIITREFEENDNHGIYSLVERNIETVPTSESCIELN